jgi:hypothetical protein
MSMLEGFRLADDVLLNAVKGISEIINIPGRINVDFADVKTVMSEMGMALMGTGIATGPNRATEAAQAAISSPLLEDVDIEGATGLLINITGPDNMSLHEISIASSLIQEAAHEDANIILGAAIDPSLQDELRVTVIATGFDQAYVAPPEKIPGMISRSQTASARLGVSLSIENPGARLENVCACHLLKMCQYWTDTAAGEFSLHYFRTKDKEEIDFVVTRDKSPWLLLECKSGMSEPTPVLKKYRELFQPKFCFQLVNKPGFERHYAAHNIWVMDHEKFLSRLV